MPRLLAKSLLVSWLFAGIGAVGAQEFTDPDQTAADHQSQAPHDKPGDPPAASPHGDLCAAIAEAAAANRLPIVFFTRLIWQESRFELHAVSRAGAQGVAQFMPGTAAWRGLADPFDPVQALPQSAAFLSELRSQFGNLGLAAAAYNAGPRRVRDWLSGRATLPGQTRAYVRIITGRNAEDWRTGLPAQEADLPPAVPCSKITLPDRPAPSSPALVQSAPMPAWGIQVAGNWSQSRALASYEMLKRRFPAILGQQEPLLLRSQSPGHGSAGFTRVRVGAETRASAEKLCSSLRSAGGACVVLRN